MTALPEAGWGPRVLDWFTRTPDLDRIQRLRSQLFVVFSFLVAVNAAVFAGLHTVHHLPGSSWTVVEVLVALCAWSLCFPLLLRMGVPSHGLTTPFMISFEVALIAIAYLDGGLASGAVFWLIVTPLAASFVGGARLGWGVAVASVLAGSALYGAAALGWTFSTALSPEHARTHYILNFVSAGLLTAGLAALYEGPMVRHFRQMSDRLTVVNAELSDELAERRAAQAASEASGRAKDVLLSNMSHEFRTPLTAILGYTDLLLDEATSDHRPLLQAVDRGAQRLLGTLDGVLELSWIAGGARLQRDLVFLRDVAARAVEATASPASTRGVAVRVVGEAIAVGDDGATTRVIGALVHNAVRFTERGTVAVRLWTEAGQAVVEVSDTGVGMPAAFVPFATEPFRQASEGDARAYEGVGLGLTAASRLTEQMGGTLGIISQEGGGTTVTVRLPAPVSCDAEAGDGAARAAPAVEALRRA